MKKILLITSHDLNLPDYGAVLRVRNIAQLLSRHGEVRIVLGSRFPAVLQSAVSPQAGFELAAKIKFWPDCYSLVSRIQAGLRQDFQNMEARPHDQERLKTVMAEHDVVWVHGLETANAFGIRHWPMSVLDIDDILSSVYRLRLSQPSSFLNKCLNWRRMIRWDQNEKKLRRRFNAICVCSEPDRKKMGCEDVFVLPNGFSSSENVLVRHPASPPQIGFVGTFNYWANCEGVRWFVDKVWPIILKRCSRIRLRVAGEGGKSLFYGQNIEALGWVRNIEEEMANWSLMIVPVLAGGGTRIKILEAFSRKCPVVSTSIGCYGHDVDHDCDLLIADRPEDFAANCLRLLENQGDGVRLAENAWKKFSQRWTWSAQAGRIAEILDHVCHIDRTQYAHVLS